MIGANDIMFRYPPREESLTGRSGKLRSGRLWSVSGPRGPVAARGARRLLRTRAGRPGRAA